MTPTPASGDALGFHCSVKDTSSGLVVDAITHVHAGRQDDGSGAIITGAVEGEEEEQQQQQQQEEGGGDNEDGHQAATGAPAEAVVSACTLKKRASWALAGMSEPGVLFLHPKAGHVLGQYKASACKAAECEPGKQVRFRERGEKTTTTTTTSQHRSDK